MIEVKSYREKSTKRKPEINKNRVTYREKGE